MKKNVKRLSEEELKNYPIVDLVDGWFFRVREISYGAFQVGGVDLWGRIVSRVGSDSEIEELLRACANDAREINKSLHKDVIDANKKPKVD